MIMDRVGAAGHGVQAIRVPLNNNLWGIKFTKLSNSESDRQRGDGGDADAQDWSQINLRGEF